MKRRGTAAALAALLALAVSSCGSSDDTAEGGDLLEQIKEENLLTVGAYSYAPYSELTSDEWTGFYSEFTTEIAKKIGVEVNAVFLAPAAFIPAVNSGRVDTVIGLSQTAEREEEVRFSDPMLYSIDCLMVKADSSIESLEDVTGKTIGLTRASAGETIAQEKIEAGVFDPADIRVYDTYEAPLQDIGNGRIDAGIWDTIGAADAALKGGIDVKCIPVSQDETGKLPDSSRVGWIFEKGEHTDSLVEAFNEAQGELQEDGTFDEILLKYGIDEPALFTGQVEQ
jgi:ABC-type amino acid transport substrate-binding protein